jgi:hypothetical protein
VAFWHGHNKTKRGIGIVVLIACPLPLPCYRPCQKTNVLKIKKPEQYHMNNSLQKLKALL